ncbi:MAG: hypothetical protein HS115_12130 [Spirochaetales bacterium]|nr:hypothetical protein [Spirochaetales bacterium]
MNDEILQKVRQDRSDLEKKWGSQIKNIQANARLFEKEFSASFVDRSEPIEQRKTAATA